MASKSVDNNNGAGTLQRTYVMDDPRAEVARLMADVSGADPTYGTWRYYFHDHLGSTRALRAADKSSLGSYEYTPYGQVYAQTGVALAGLGGSFTGKPWDATAQLYFFPYRYYSPDAARWTQRDPLGMADGPNVYVYVTDPLGTHDPMGLCGIREVVPGKSSYHDYTGCEQNCFLNLGICRITALEAYGVLMIKISAAATWAKISCKGVAMLWGVKSDNYRLCKEMVADLLKKLDRLEQRLDRLYDAALEGCDLLFEDCMDKCNDI